MPEPTDPTIQHQGHLGTGNGLVQFVCCNNAEPSFDALWVAPGGKGAANVFHSPRQAYELVVRHLTHDQYDDATLTPILQAAEQQIREVAASEVPGSEPWVRSHTDVRPSVEYLANRLDAVTLTIDGQ